MTPGSYLFCMTTRDLKEIQLLVHRKVHRKPQELNLRFSPSLLGMHKWPNDDDCINLHSTSSLTGQAQPLSHSALPSPQQITFFLFRLPERNKLLKTSICSSFPHLFKQIPFVITLECVHFQTTIFIL